MKAKKTAKEITKSVGLGSAVNTVAKGTVDGAAAFLSRICLPAAEEFGLLLRDKVRDYRARNMTKITKEAEEILKQFENTDIHAHPRLVSQIMEHGSWADDDAIQKKWAGLLISSCDNTGEDDSNLIFIDLLSQLSTVQVKILDHACQHANKIVYSADVLSCNQYKLNSEQIITISGVEDVHRIHRELAHLRTLGLLVDGQIAELFYKPEVEGVKARPITYIEALVTPSDLAFHLYTRSKGFNGSPVEYFFGQDYFSGETV
jgi:hypothetical protein